MNKSLIQIIPLALAITVAMDASAGENSRLIVKFKTPNPGNSARALGLSEEVPPPLEGIQNLRRIFRGRKFELAMIETSEQNRKSTLSKLKSDPNVEYVEMDSTFSLPPLEADAQPFLNDPLSRFQWHLTPEALGGSLYHIDILPAWLRGQKGDPQVIIGVIDTGVQSDHPDLVGNLVPGHNFIQENDDTTDDVGHGTHVTGIIGATRLNSVGIAGIVPGASIMPLKVCARDGCQTSNIIHAVEYAAHHGVSVVNMSLGGPNYSQVMRDALEEAAAAGMIAVSSTGNDGCNMDMDSECRAYPAMYQLDNQISVASIRPDGLLSQFSNYGFHRADIAAPGENILSTTVGSNYIVLSGTSMATPMVTGAVALLRSIFPKESHQNIIARITQCGHPLPTGSALNVRSGNALDIEAAIAGGACLSAAGK